MEQQPPRKPHNEDEFDTEEFMRQLSNLGRQVGKGLNDAAQQLGDVLNAAATEAQQAAKQAQHSAREAAKQAQQQSKQLAARRPKPSYQYVYTPRPGAPRYGYNPAQNSLVRRKAVQGMQLRVGRVGHAVAGTFCAAVAVTVAFGVAATLVVGNFTAAGICAGITALTGWASSHNFSVSRLGRRAQQYLQAMDGRKHCYVQELAAYTHRSEKKVKKDLNALANRGWLPAVLLTPDGKEVYTDQAAYRECLESEFKPAPAVKPPEPSPQPTADPAAGEAQEAQFLRRLQELNALIEDEGVHSQVEHICTVAEKIFAQAARKSAPPASLRKFTKYYMPTTIKLLETYTQIDDEPVEGANMETIRSDIPGILYTLDKAYGNLLDDLYADVAMDVSSDISVLRSMLAQEGLAVPDAPESEEEK